MPPFVILAFLANLVVWRIFEPNRANPRVKHSVSIYIGPGWGQNCEKKITKEIFKIGPKKSAIRPFFGSKTAKTGTGEEKLASWGQTVTNPLDEPKKMVM